MAKAPAPPAKPNNPLGEEADARLAEARQQKYHVEPDLREAYFLTFPRLSRQVMSSLQPLPTPPRDSSALATSLGSEVVEDFATEVINAFLPPTFNWAASEPGEGVPDALWSQVKDKANENDKAIFRAIRASNFDAELATMLIPDGGLGTMAMWIDDRVASEPLECQHVPIRELEINIGPNGGVDDRFIVRWVRARKVKAVFPGLPLPKKVVDKATKGRGEEWIECRWGYWRDWSKPADTVWTYVIQVDGEVIDNGSLQGEGSCPLIVGRFSPDSLHAFGNGPTLQSLPHLRIVDVLATLTQDRADVAMAPPLAYPDDGVLNFDQGIESGKAYPKRPGSKGEIESLYFQGDPNVGVYTLQDLTKSIRRKHFADYPDQPGKTPPTATQWLDEMVKSQRRIGTPGQKFWQEFPAEVFLRFKYLVTKRGIIQPLAKDNKAIATRPRNPATKAQEQQKVQVAQQLMSMAKTFFPVTSNAAIDELATIKKLQDAMGDELVVLRAPEQVNAMVASLMKGASMGPVEGRGGGGTTEPGQMPAQGAPQ